MLAARLGLGLVSLGLLEVRTGNGLDGLGTRNRSTC